MIRFGKNEKKNKKRAFQALVEARLEVQPRFLPIFELPVRLHIFFEVSAIVQYQREISSERKMAKRSFWRALEWTFGQKLSFGQSSEYYIDLSWKEEVKVYKVKSEWRGVPLISEKTRYELSPPPVFTLIINIVLILLLMIMIINITILLIISHLLPSPRLGKAHSWLRRGTGRVVAALIDAGYLWHLSDNNPQTCSFMTWSSMLYKNRWNLTAKFWYTKIAPRYVAHLNP